MLPRKPLAPNNRNSLSQTMLGSVKNATTNRAPRPKAKEEPSIRTWARAGRQNSEGFGGGARVGRRQK